LSSDHQSSHGKKKAPLLLNVHHPAGGHDEGEGNWLVSYADMMTLLVGFFVILLSFSTVDQQKYDKMKQAVTEEFGGTYQEPFTELTDQIKGTIDKMGMGDGFIIKKSADGVEISLQGAVFFESGSADLRQQARDMLNQVIPVIKTKAKDFKITIEGHTDDSPIYSPMFHNNWELSSVRACRVLDVFAQEGIPTKNLTPVGLADTKPLVRNRDENGIPIPQNQAQNRRVVIRVQKPVEQLLKDQTKPVSNATAQMPMPQQPATPAPSTTTK
jgi:chemotaxis protein MotB